MTISKASLKAIESAITAKQKRYDKLKKYYDSGDKIKGKYQGLIAGQTDFIKSVEFGTKSGQAKLEVRLSELEASEKDWKKWLLFDYEALLQLESDIASMRIDVKRGKQYHGEWDI